ncbi:hypothetical protein [Nannocystis pusilla]|uniref:hypothetical protein n=1 Tax=Nannocystis pusilla TaxID=889268 RepID=UPI003DA6BC8C
MSGAGPSPEGWYCEKAIAGKMPYGCRPTRTAGSGPRPETWRRKNRRVASMRPSENTGGIISSMK